MLVGVELAADFDIGSLIIVVDAVVTLPFAKLHFEGKLENFNVWSELPLASINWRVPPPEANDGVVSARPAGVEVVTGALFQIMSRPGTSTAIGLRVLVCRLNVIADPPT